MESLETETSDLIQHFSLPLRGREREKERECRKRERSRAGTFGEKKDLDKSEWRTSRQQGDR